MKNSNCAKLWLVALAVCVWGVIFECQSYPASFETSQSSEISWIHKNQYSWGVSVEHANSGIRGYTNNILRWIKEVIVSNGVIGFIVVIFWYFTLDKFALMLMLIQDAFTLNIFGIPCVILESFFINPLQLVLGCFKIYL